MDRILNQFEETFDNNLNISIGIAVVVVIFSISRTNSIQIHLFSIIFNIFYLVIYLLKNKSSAKVNSVLITGLSNGGKTTLYSQVKTLKLNL